MKNVLIIDDNANDRNLFGRIIAAADFDSVEACDGKSGVEALKKGGISAIFLDLKLPDMDGIETMKELKKIDPGVPIILVTAFADIPTAVKATKLGAYDFVIKPPDFEVLVLSLKRAIEKQTLEKEVQRLHAVVDTSFKNLLGKSEAAKRIVQEVQQVALSDFSIIIQGETGTGKTTLAKEIHNISNRSDKPFVKVDIGTLSESLIESELFGHEKGSFTGADRKKKGFFEVAHGGTIFIDEIENMPPSAQTKLLNVIEEKKIFLVGSSKPVNVDIRIIAATNADMEMLVREKKMRQDLYYRLGEFSITIPPLRERPADIQFFAAKFLEDAYDELKKPVGEITEEALESLVHHSWPGNIRELKNVIKKAALFSSNKMINAQDLRTLIAGKSAEAVNPLDFNKPEGGTAEDALKIRTHYPGPASSIELNSMIREAVLSSMKELINPENFKKLSPEKSVEEEIPSNLPLKEAVKLQEIKSIQQALEASNGNRDKAATILQISPRGLYAKLKEYGIGRVEPLSQ